jgi:hypothetical protein
MAVLEVDRHRVQRGVDFEGGQDDAVFKPFAMEQCPPYVLLVLP